MNLTEQIEQLKANPNVGGVEWEIEQTDIDLFATSHFTDFKIIVDFAQREVMVQIDGNHTTEFKLASTTLNEALIEALDIVKAKVKELANELGLVCLTESEYNKLKDPYGRGEISQSTEF